MNLSRFYAIIQKEFIHVFKDKASFIIVLMMPIIFSLVFGYAVTTDIEDIQIAVLDNDKTVESREIIKKFNSSDYFLTDYYVNSIDEIEDLISGNKVKGAMIIPSGFASSIQRGEDGNYQLILDGSDPNVSRVALQYGNLIASQYKLSKGVVEGEASFGLSTRVWFNPNMKSALFVIPALIGLIMQNITILLTAFSLVREREKGTIEQLIVSPVKPIELILGKMIPYIVIGSFDFMLALFFGTWYFSVPIVGSLGLLIVLGFGFVIVALALGMLVSTIAKTQLEAMQLVILILLPSVILSGFMFPVEAMPMVVQWISRVIPLTYFIDILRGIILKGVGIQFLWPEVYTLLFMGLVLLTLATIRFRKKLD
ncbi:MAG: ABC transporter permease [Clostridia bacterium]|nr:ABC transporter permease [Clostridia bacterium]